MQVEITIRVLGKENETAESLLSRVSGLIRDQPSVLVHYGPADKAQTEPVTPPEEKAAEPASSKPAKSKSDDGDGKRKRGRPKKDEALKKEPEPVKDDEDDEDEDAEDDALWELQEVDEDGGGDDEDAAEDDEDAAEDDDDEQEAQPVKAAPKEKAKGKKAQKLTLEGDIIPAFRALTSNHGNAAGASILKKFGVQSVRDLADEQYAEVLTAIHDYKAPAVKRRPKQ